MKIVEKAGLLIKSAITATTLIVMSSLISTVEANQSLAFSESINTESNPSLTSTLPYQIARRNHRQLAVWLMNGTQVRQNGSNLRLQQGWKVIDAGDFNGDGNSDVLLHNRYQSQLAVWLMNGTRRIQAGGNLSLQAGWKPIDSGDFNGDGNSDVLLYNPNQSKLAVWLMNGTQLRQGGRGFRVNTRLGSY